MAITIRILAFGVASELCGTKSFTMEVEEGITLHALKAKLTALHPALNSIIHFNLALNRKYESPESMLNAQDEVAIIPPVSGG